MNREQFVSLPASVALGMIWDAFPGIAAKLAPVEPPRLARAPKYDTAIYRKDGITWASEYDVEGLRFWRGKKAESAARVDSEDPKIRGYAEKDAKMVKALDFFIAWRLVEPTACWSGERNRQHVTARPPSGKPEVYQRDDGPRRADAPPADFDFDAATDGDLHDPALDDIF